jgi:hypothetical protein
MYYANVSSEYDNTISDIPIIKDEILLPILIIPLLTPIII